MFLPVKGHDLNVSIIIYVDTTHLSDDFVWVHFPYAKVKIDREDYAILHQAMYPMQYRAIRQDKRGR